MDTDVARGLKDALVNLEEKRNELEIAPDEQLVEAASAYQQARRDAGPAFDAAQRAFESDLRSEGQADPVPEGSAPDTASEPEGPTEASPGVPLISPPGEVVSTANLGRYGALGSFTPKETESEVEAVQATPYAFAEGTAISTPEGTLATTQPSRVVLAHGKLGVVPNDVFNQTYEPVAGETVSELPEGGQYPNGPEAAETPVEGAPSE